VLLAAVPILSIGEMINMENLASGDAAVSEAMGKSAAHVGETAAMIREVKAFGLENTMFAAYDALLSAPRREERNKALRGAAAFGLAQSMTMLFYAFAFWYGAELISQGEIEFYDFMKALWALGFCAAGAGQAAAFAGDAAAAQTAASRVFSMIDRVPAIDAQPFLDGKLPGSVDKGMEVRPVPTSEAEAKAAGKGRIIPNDRLVGKVTFDDVKFSYPQRPESAVLNGLSFAVEPGTTVALIGQSGSGKSTAVQLLERFYDPVTPEALKARIDAERDAKKENAENAAAAPSKKKNAEPVLASVSVVPSAPDAVPDSAGAGVVALDGARACVRPAVAPLVYRAGGAGTHAVLGHGARQHRGGEGLRRAGDARGGCRGGANRKRARVRVSHGQRVRQRRGRGRRFGVRGAEATHRDRSRDHREPQDLTTRRSNLRA